MDFQAVTFHLSVPREEPQKVICSIASPCYDELMGYGGSDVLKEEYGDALQATPEDGFDMTVVLDISEMDEEDVIAKTAGIKRKLYGAPLELCLKALVGGTSGSLPGIDINYHKNELLYLVPGPDRVVVVVQIDFEAEVDRAIADIFLQEMPEVANDMGRRLGNVPTVKFSVDPPEDIAGMRIEQTENHVGYVTILLFATHVNTEEKRAKCIDLVTSFRSYVHYHVKASKALLHSRMRTKTADFLKVLRRAKLSTKTTAARRKENGDAKDGSKKRSFKRKKKR
jgi:actin related protein 2/3 complex subunit 2